MSLRVSVSRPTDLISGVYRVQLFVEDPTAVEPPKDRVALAVEEDNCGGTGARSRGERIWKGP